MRCNICDKALSEKEIQWNKDIETYDPCSFCLDVAMEAAFGRDQDDTEFVVLESDFDDEDDSPLFYSSFINPLREVVDD